MCPEHNTGQALFLTLAHMGTLLTHQDCPAPLQGTDAAVPLVLNPMLGHQGYYTGQKHISGEEFKMPVTCLSKAHKQLAAEGALTQQVRLTDATGMYQFHVP